nr:MAG TPA: hypothetical protein [Caudoviricetes sp.]
MKSELKTARFLHYRLNEKGDVLTHPLYYPF